MSGKNMERSRIDDFGSIFRFLTPIMLCIFGWISIQYLSLINIRFENIDKKFDNFLESYHIIDKRVDILEYEVFKKRKIITATTVEQ